MLLINDILSTVSRAPRSALPEMSRKVWVALANEDITENQADTISRAIHGRQQELKADQRPAGRPKIEKPQSRQRPDRSRRIELRRKQAASGVVPSALAGAFTGGEVAALAVVGRQAASGRPCDWPLARIAALAGVGVTTVRNALRLAQRLGMVRVMERRRTANRSLTNLVTVTCSRWLGWLRRSSRSGGGSKKLKPMNTEVIIPTPVKGQERHQKGGYSTLASLKTAVPPG